MKKSVYNALVSRISQDCYHTKVIHISLVKRAEFFPLEDDSSIQVAYQPPMILAVMWINSTLYALDHERKVWTSLTGEELQETLEGYTSFTIVEGA